MWPLLLLAGLGGAGYWYYENHKVGDPNAILNDASVSLSSQQKDGSYLAVVIFKFSDGSRIRASLPINATQVALEKSNPGSLTATIKQAFNTQAQAGVPPVTYSQVKSQLSVIPGVVVGMTVGQIIDNVTGAIHHWPAEQQGDVWHLPAGGTHPVVIVRGEDGCDYFASSQVVGARGGGGGGGFGVRPALGGGGGGSRPPQVRSPRLPLAASAPIVPSPQAPPMHTSAPFGGGGGHHHHHGGPGWFGPWGYGWGGWGPYAVYFENDQCTQDANGNWWCFINGHYVPVNGG